MQALILKENKISRMLERGRSTKLIETCHYPSQSSINRQIKDRQTDSLHRWRFLLPAEPNALLDLPHVCKWTNQSGQWKASNSGCVMSQSAPCVGIKAWCLCGPECLYIT